MTFSNGCTSIGKSAFSGCSNLASIDLGSSCTSIGNQAFWGCSSLASISLPEGLTGLGSQAFVSCASLESITIPAGIGMLSSGDFVGCAKLAEAKVHYGTRVPASAFPATTTVTRLRNAASTDPAVLGEGAFGNCNWTYYSSYKGQDSVLVVSAKPESDGRFADGTAMVSRLGSVKHLVVEEGVTYLGSYFMDNATELETVDFPKSLQEIAGKSGILCFSGLSSLKEIRFPEGSKLNALTPNCFGGMDRLVVDLSECTEFAIPAATLPEVFYEGNVAKLVMPKNLASFDGFWLSDYRSVGLTFDEVVLPATLAEVKLRQESWDKVKVTKFTAPCSLSAEVKAALEGTGKTVEYAHEFKAPEFRWTGYIASAGDCACASCDATEAPVVSTAVSEDGLAYTATALLASTGASWTDVRSDTSAADRAQAAADAKAEVEAKYQGYVSAEAAKAAAEKSAADARAAAEKAAQEIAEKAAQEAAEAQAKAVAEAKAGAEKSAAQKAAASKQSLATYKAYKAAKSGKYKGKLKAAKSFYVLKGAKVAKVSGSKRLSVTKAGKVVVKKGTKKGVYTAKVKVKTAQGTQTVTVTVRVR